MSHELRDRRFGREEEVAALLAQIAKPGLTAVVGRAQIGKSWLLNEVARQLTDDAPRRLVEIAESKGEAPDRMLRASPPMDQILRAVHGITGTLLVLILDQWEKSPDVGIEAETLRSFVRATEEWPPPHSRKPGLTKLGTFEPTRTTLKLKPISLS